MLKLAAILLSFLLTLSTARADDGITPMDVSMIQLIANPEKFDGKTVVLTGFMNLEFEGNALYLHRDDFVYGQMKNGLGLTLSEGLAKSVSRWTRHYVRVEGVFNAREAGHFGMYSGAIEQVTRVTGLGRRLK
jgi:hypothetical protein